MTSMTPQVAAALEAAVRAPSVHNSQPWKFAVGPDRIDLYADPERALPVADPGGRELRISCGAALLNLRLALGQRGIATTVHLGADDGLLATVHLAAGGLASADDAELARVIDRRRTNRKPFLDDPVDAADRHHLQEAARAERGVLEIVTDRRHLAEMHRILLRAHAAQTSDPAWTAEFTQWVARARQDKDGVALTASGPSPEPQDEWALRDFGLGQAASRSPGKDFESDPLIAVVATFADDPATQVQAGQVLQRVLLTATARGLAASFLSQLVEVDEAREELRSLLGSRVYPQAVLRIGHGNPVAASARRPLAEVLIG